MKSAKLVFGLTLLGSLVTAQSAFAQGSFTVIPFEFDPYNTHLVAAEWKGGLGCPTNANTAPFLPPDFSTVGTSSYTDPACPTGDPWDKHNEGLLLAKTGPTNNDASAGAMLQGVKGTVLTGLGFDIRKPGPGLPLVTFPGDQSDPRGSHCGAGAPRFNIVIGGYFYFLGCNSPTPDSDTPGNGWQRLRWGTTTDLSASPQCSAGFCGPGKDNPCTASIVHPSYCNIKGQMVDSIEIIFDEGDDTGPDNFGLAILDNIDVNGMLVGRGPGKPEDNDRDEGQGEDGDHDKFQFHDSPSRPESSNVSFQDQSQNMKLQSVNGARSVTYNGACVTLVGDALVNDEPGYLLTFAACNLSGPLGIGIGNLSVAVTGPSGVVYQKSTALTSGYVSIHPQ